MDRTEITTDGRRPTVHVKTRTGLLAVDICPQCAALVLAENGGPARHEDKHAADARRVDEIADRAIAFLELLVAAQGARPR